MEDLIPKEEGWECFILSYLAGLLFGTGIADVHGVADLAKHDGIVCWQFCVYDDAGLDKNWDGKWGFAWLALLRVLPMKRGHT
jgi:hypothetical protein